MSADGRRLFVADAGAGRILVVTRDGRSVRSLAGSRGTRPRGLDVQQRGAAQRIVFTGRTPSDGAPAVLSLSAGGAQRATVLAKGAPLRRPQGVAAAQTARSTSATAVLAATRRRSRRARSTT